MYHKQILSNLKRSGIPERARCLGYEIVSDLSQCSQLQAHANEKDIYCALEFLITNFENEEVYIKTSGLLSLVHINCKGNNKLTEATKAMLLDREDSETQIRGCQEVTKEKNSDDTKAASEFLSSGTLEALFITALSHRSNRNVIIEVCKAVTHIGMIRRPEVGERITSLKFDKILVSFLSIHKDSRDFICELCKAIYTIGYWIRISANEVTPRIRQDFMDEPEVKELIKNLNSWKILVCNFVKSQRIVLFYFNSCML